MPSTASDQHQRVAAVLELAAAEAAHDVLPAQHQVDEHEREGRDQVRAQPPGQRPAGARPGEDAHRQGEAERGEEVDESLQEAHGAHALQRWLCTDWWARNRPNVMTLR